MSSVFDVTEADFDAQVVERSKTTPVLVDFWAPWCGPCRMLGPTLERLANEADGAFVLAKANTQEHPRLGARFGIRGIPAVKLFMNGQVAGEFVGAQPEPAVRQFLANLLPNEADALAAEAAQHVITGNLDAAAEALDRAHEIDPLNDAAERVRGQLALARACAGAGGIDACRAAATADSSDLDARYAVGACLASAGDYRGSLDALLGVVADARGDQRDAARRAMLAVFDLAGARSELSDEYRRKLAIYL